MSRCDKTCSPQDAALHSSSIWGTTCVCPLSPQRPHPSPLLPCSAASLRRLLGQSPSSVSWLSERCWGYSCLPIEQLFSRCIFSGPYLYLRYQQAEGTRMTGTLLLTLLACLSHRAQQAKRRWSRRIRAPWSSRLSPTGGCWTGGGSRLCGCRPGRVRECLLLRATPCHCATPPPHPCLLTLPPVPLPSSAPPLHHPCTTRALA